MIVPLVFILAGYTYYNVTTNSSALEKRPF